MDPKPGKSASLFLQPITALLLIIGLLGTLCLPAAGAASTTIMLNVDSTTDDPALFACEDHLAGDCSLRGAINHANGDTGNDYVINIPDGTYVLGGASGENLNASGDLDILHPNLTLQGISRKFTILDGAANDRVIDLLGATNNLTINDLTIQNGSLSSGGGGGIQVGGGNSLTLNNGAVIGNSAAAGSNGGGILGWNESILTIQNSLIRNNAAESGGGIAAKGCTLNVYDSIVDQNTAVQTGGGIAAVEGGNLITIQRSLIGGSGDYFNTANRGGGIYNTTVSTLTVSDSTFENNQADISGGGLCTYGTVTLTNVTLHGNDAVSTTYGDGGGGIYIYQEVDMVNVSVISNTAGSHGGGVIVANGGDLSLNHVTLSLNTAEIGKAIYAASGSTVNTVSSIFHEIGTGTACTIFMGANWSTSFYNLSNDDSCQLVPGFDIINTSPLFGSYGDHGGPTYTMSLQRTSPAIDQGKPGDPADRLDQRGIPIQDGDLNGTWLSDIGAYEYIPPFFLTFIIKP